MEDWDVWSHNVARVVIYLWSALEWCVTSTASDDLWKIGTRLRLLDWLRMRCVEFEESDTLLYSFPWQLNADKSPFQRTFANQVWLNVLSNFFTIFGSSSVVCDSMQIGFYYIDVVCKFGLIQMSVYVLGSIETLSKYGSC